jgi:hypothetical protein
MPSSYIWPVLFRSIFSHVYSYFLPTILFLATCESAICHLISIAKQFILNKMLNLHWIIYSSGLTNSYTCRKFPGQPIPWPHSLSKFVHIWIPVKLIHSSLSGWRFSISFNTVAFIHLIKRVIRKQLSRGFGARSHSSNTQKVWTSMKC